MADVPGGNGIRSKGVRSDLREMLGQFRRDIIKDAKPRGTTARFVFAEAGFDPAKKMIELYDKAMTAYDQGRGLSDNFDPGPQYLAIAAKMVESASRITYPSIAPVKVKFADAEENDATNPDTDPKKYSAVQVRDAILSDPYAAERADTKEAQRLQEEEMQRLHSASVAAIAKGEIDALESILPVGAQDQVPENTGENKTPDPKSEKE